MNQYEKRFYEDIHKLVKIQEGILKELQKLNKPIEEENKTLRFNKMLTKGELTEEYKNYMNEELYTKKNS